MFSPQKTFTPIKGIRLLEVLKQGLKHAAHGPHVAREGILSGPRCFLGIFK